MIIVPAADKSPFTASAYSNLLNRQCNYFVSLRASLWLKKGVNMKDGAQSFNEKDFNSNLFRQIDPFGFNEEYLVEFLIPSIKIHPQILQPLQALISKANAAGFDMRVASAFRGFERQLLIWNNKALGLRSVLNENGIAINLNSMTDDEKVFAILRWSALPGASRHHWGTDLDVYDASRMAADYQLQLTVEETQGDGPCAQFHYWLTQELQENETDFFRPYVEGVGSISPEPWHLSYAPLAHLFASQLSEENLREKIQAADIVLKDSILKNLSYIFANYIKPYQ
jgi:LAS superfamily LD-carboxypeptidase LdcB